MPAVELIEREQTSTAVERGLIKVPQITVAFWVAKVLTTGMGESTSDFLAARLGPFPAVTLGAVVFAASLALQLRVRRYVPWIYWTAVAMVSVFGTMAADVLHIGLGIPYTVSSTFYAVLLAVIFGVWYATERTLSIHGIRSGRRELFYWATVLATFALGTATGDLTASTLNLGYLPSGLLFAAAIALPALAHWRLGLDPILAFWIAYVLTRPLGASFADWAAVSPLHRGLGYGTGPVSLTLAVLIVGVVGYLTVAGRRKA